MRIRAKRVSNNLKLLSLASAASIAMSIPASAQGLRDKISDLFIFGPGQEPLFLAGSADPNNPASLQAHGLHFIPSSAAENGSIISFITDALGASVANIPIGSTSGGVTFRFEGGVPVPTSTSAGPIFAERAQTLGRGRILAGISRTGFRFATLRGVDMDNIGLVFTHQNVDFEGCDAQFGGDCTLYGIPVLENDAIDFHLSMDLNVRVTSMYLTYGMTDRFDLGLVVPIVQADFRGESDAQIRPFGGTTAAHYFAGTSTNPVLSAHRQSLGSAAGLGDVALRAKINFRQTPGSSFAFLVDGRFPTGSPKDLLGSGKFAGRALAIFNSRFGDFSPHLNAGYLYHAGTQQNDAVLGTVGFDNRLAESVTLAADLVTELQVGDSKLHLPPLVAYESPFRRTLNPTNIPDIRDDIVNGSFGVKLIPARNTTLVLNSLFPLNRGGLRANLVYTAGIEYTF
ncbi:MAG TPA: transporter [Gemmatimonadaceae bacterium]|nr:transporter [Gemmatimonadaceae bacterium]